MNLKVYLSLMTMATIICLIGLITVMALVNPEATNWLGFLLFYLALFFSVFGLLAIIGFVIRFILLKQQLAVKAALIAFRQSALVSFLLVAVLFFLAEQLFSWINIILLIIGLSLLEFFLLGYENGLQEEIIN